MDLAVPHQLSLEQVRHIAKLSRLRLSDDDLQEYRSQLAAVLDHITELSELDVEGVEPMAHPTELTNRMEDDVAGPAMPIELLLMNAPAGAVEDRFLTVPKILEE